MHWKRVIVVLCFLFIPSVDAQEDFMETYKEFSFFHHSSHQLLLAIESRNCYYVPLNKDLHDDLIYPRTRNSLLDRVISAIRQKYRGVRAATLSAVRDIYKDRLADFHCLEKDIFIVKLNEDCGDDFVGDCSVTYRGMCSNAIVDVLCQKTCNLCEVNNGHTRTTTTPIATSPPAATTTTGDPSSCRDHVVYDLHCGVLPNVCESTLLALSVCKRFCGFCSSATSHPHALKPSPSGHCYDLIGDGMTCAYLPNICSHDLGTLLCPKHCGKCQGTTQTTFTAAMPTSAPVITSLPPSTASTSLKTTVVRTAATQTTSVSRLTTATMPHESPTTTPVIESSTTNSQTVSTTTRFKTRPTNAQTVSPTTNAQTVLSTNNAQTVSPTTNPQTVSTDSAQTLSSTLITQTVSPATNAQTRSRTTNVRTVAEIIITKTSPAASISNSPAPSKTDLTQDVSTTGPKTSFGVSVTSPRTDMTTNDVSTSIVCADKLSGDGSCAKMDSQFHICASSDGKTACPKYCGFCTSGLQKASTPHYSTMITSIPETSTMPTTSSSSSTAKPTSEASTMSLPSTSATSPTAKSMSETSTTTTTGSLLSRCEDVSGGVDCGHLVNICATVYAASLCPRYCALCLP